MSGVSWPPYPPCVSGTCTDSACCTLGRGQRKFRWPELRGKNGGDAKNQINKDAPFVTVVFIRPGQVALPNFCCNRVNVVLDPSGKVSNIPFIG
ncbi:proteinase inhibitor-like [Cucumis melo var. makuwa]|uniref:Proteinase inhibitor-like n=1 Tax=Cucumis melo var. makuwa TaxID=1194695 RepID=A0A5D3DF00_CUCMM|nr:proteinase inhibitor-like [Cucumis melo var. makuwa]TYK21960.1 proteinase inhibitor-like [Cucumis melo var. makuwa]TYK21972.1 proteinase inhibitor-like [Cucumis melo var. makuwa]